MTRLATEVPLSQLSGEKWLNLCHRLKNVLIYRIVFIHCTTETGPKDHHLRRKTTRCATLSYLISRLCTPEKSPSCRDGHTPDAGHKLSHPIRTDTSRPFSGPVFPIWARDQSVLSLRHRRDTVHKGGCRLRAGRASGETTVLSPPCCF